MTRLIPSLFLPLLFLASAIAQDRPQPSRFTAVDIFIDPQGQPLAAWQLEVSAEVGQISLVGVEAGEHPAYAKRPPYYDPAALSTTRVILGDYSLDQNLPQTATRVARLMLEVRGDRQPQYVAKLSAAADPTGNPIKAAVIVK